MKEYFYFDLRLMLCSWHESLNGSAEDLTCADENISSSVSRFIGKFVDRVCAEAYISNELSKDLIRKIATMVDMQVFKCSWLLTSTCIFTSLQQITTN